MPTSSPKRLSCKRCQFRKLKCSRTDPCGNCTAAKHKCEYRENDDKRRPASHAYVSGLENRVAWLESLLARLKGASSEERDHILSDVEFGDHLKPSEGRRVGASEGAGTTDGLGPQDRARPGIVARRSHLYHLDPEGSLVYHGPTSIYHVSMTNAEPKVINLEPSAVVADGFRSSHLSYVSQHFGIDLTGQLIKTALLHFFRWQYPHFMFIYREAFLRDHFSHDSRKKYWSEQLLLAVCAHGLLMTDEPDARQSSEQCFAAAESILLVSGLAQACITNVQAFLLMAFYEIGRGHLSKGWEYSGIAFRMALDLGFQKDPQAWIITDKALATPEDVEIRRRIYWGCYISDKLISLILGRPVSLHDDDAEVESTETLPDFPDMAVWLPAGHNDGAAASYLVPSFQMQVGLAKIIQRMLVQIYSPKCDLEGSRRKAGIDDLELSLCRWGDSLASFLRWNRWQPAKSTLLPTVASLHILHHSIRVVLNFELAINTTPSLHNEVHKAACLSSSQDIIAILRKYRSQHGLRHAPVTLIYGAVQAGKVSAFMGIPEEFNYILQALDEFSSAWDLAKDAKKHLLEACQGALRGRYDVG